MSRWFSEFRQPALKCARVGHDMIDRKQVVFLYPSTHIFRSMYVADRVTEVTPTCARCGHAAETQTLSHVGLSGLSMSARDWDELKRTGRLEA